MGIVFDSQLFMRIPKKIKEKAEKKAAQSGKTLSQYIRDLIVNDIKKV